MKKCSKCGSLGPFYKDRQKSDGLTSWCKKCVNTRVEQWKEKNPERAKEIVREWDALHPDRHRERSVQWVREHKERNRNNQKRWLSEHPNKAFEYTKKYFSTHPEKLKELKRNRYALKKKAIGKIKSSEWKNVVEKYGNKCIYPGCENTKVTMDHIIPLSLGGTHTIDNVQPLCHSHNSRKHIKTTDYRKGIT